MSDAVTFKCPSCGAYLEFNPEDQQFSCPYCGQQFTEQQMRGLAENKAVDAAFDSALRSYHCQACGAEVVTDDTTAATRCYYCHNPVVLSDRLQGEFRPEAVLPFKLTREQAMEKFKQFIAGKKYVDRRFFSDEQLECFNGVYYPYWLGDIDAQGSFEGQGTRVSTRTTSQYIETTTRNFHVEREGRLSFRNMVRKALSKADRQLSDGIHPYDLNEMKPFSMSYLSGFLAEKRDIEETGVRNEMLEEAKGYAPSMMKKGASFDSLNGKTTFKPTGVKMRYVLLPAWVLTYKSGSPDAVYYYMMNGQTGEVCGKLPIDKGRLMQRALTYGAIVAGLLMAGGAFIW